MNRPTSYRLFMVVLTSALPLGPPAWGASLTSSIAAGTSTGAAGPVISLPDEATPSPGPDGAQDLVRGLREHRFEIAANTSIGGYVELHYNRVMPAAAGSSDTGQLDLHRFVLFVAHNFDEDLRFYGELEVEHAEEIGIEQAFLDYRLLGDALGLRAGVVLVPMGIINQWHEPPVFHGVERPRVDNAIIPSTWREGGVGIFGSPIEGLSYELYVVGGLDARGFSSSSGLRGGRQKVAEALTNSFAITGRAEWEPMLGLVVGGSGYYGDAGPNGGELFGPGGAALELEVPVLGLSADARIRHRGLEARALFAQFWIGGTADLRTSVDEAGTAGPDVGARLLGYYVELAYDVLSLLDTEQALLPFARFEVTDTLAGIEGRPETAADEAREVRDLVFGLTYRPIPQVVFKTDLILREPAGASEGASIFSVGVGAMF